MKIKTNCGDMEVQAWHVGRHVMMVVPGLKRGICGGHFRLDGNEVTAMFNALYSSRPTIVELPRENDIINIVCNVHAEGCTLDINDVSLELSIESHTEIQAVFATAYYRDTKGLDELNDAREREDYGLPPKSDDD